MIENLTSLLETNLDIHLLGFKTQSPNFHKVLHYATLPAGKLFRPQLVVTAFADLKGKDAALSQLKDPGSALSLCASAVELHHAYTLIHDDLPCMDDDDERRGKPSVHKEFGQWQAVLAGDALLHHSHNLLSRIEEPKPQTIQKIFGWALGAKGLILGQVFDLEGEISKDFNGLLRTHTLKTARLIQTALLFGKWCAHGHLDFSVLKETLRLGQALGLSFQLLDDLSEGTEPLSVHEQEVNPFIRFPAEAMASLESSLITVQKTIERQENNYLGKALSGYLSKMENIIREDLKKENSLILKNLQNSKDDIEGLLAHIKS